MQKRKEMSNNMTVDPPYDNTTLKHCYRCGMDYTQYPSLSRRDNKTYVCNDCGLDEALVDNSLYNKFMLAVQILHDKNMQSDDLYVESIAREIAFHKHIFKPFSEYMEWKKEMALTSEVL